MGEPLILSSAYRCPAYNDTISSSGTTGAHTTGCAVDIKISRDSAFKLLSLAPALGFTGIGVNQKGHSRFIHLDTVGKPFLRPTIWSY